MNVASPMRIIERMRNQEIRARRESLRIPYPTWRIREAMVELYALTYGERETIRFAALNLREFGGQKKHGGTQKNNDSDSNDSHDGLDQIDREPGPQI